MTDFENRSHFLIDVPTIPDLRGKIAVIEPERILPFSINRTYHLFDVPAGAERGGHAHKALDQFLIAVSGSFTVDVEDINGKYSYALSRPNEGLYIGSMVWRSMRNFSSNAVCFVLASKIYDESDYIRTYDEFQAKVAEVRNASSVC